MNLARTTLIVAALAVLAAACSSSGEAGPASSLPEATSTTTTSTTSTLPPTTTIDELERNRTVNELLDAARANASCTSFDCIAAQAVYNRYTALTDLAGEIPGSDVSLYALDIQAAFSAWNKCLSGAEDRFECSAEEEATAEAITDLYNALR